MTVIYSAIDWFNVGASAVTVTGGLTPIALWFYRRMRAWSREIKQSREAEAQCRIELGMMKARYLTLDFNFRRLWEVVKRSWPAHIQVGQDGAIQNWCKQASRIFGWTDAEIIGRPVSTLVPPESIAEHRN